MVCIRPRLTRKMFFLGVMIGFPCFAQLRAPPKQSKRKHQISIFQCLYQTLDDTLGQRCLNTAQIA